MHDLRYIRENPEAFDAELGRRGAEAASARILEIDAARRAAQTMFQEMQERRNTLSREIGKVKKEGGDADALMAEVQGLKEGISGEETSEREHSVALQAILQELPNIAAADVPDGRNEDDNVEVRAVGEKTQIEGGAKEHFDLGEALGQMDFEAGAKLSGARFVVLRGGLARMERAIANFMLDMHTEEFGYTEIVPPALVRDETLYGTGQLPKFAEDLFHTDDGYWLIPTAEVPLTSLVSGDILREDDLPLRFTAWTPCFRSEAGAAGKDTRGMIRQHQFSKVELVSVTHPERSDEELERMTNCAEEVLKRLGLAYRVMMLCTGDMGFGARKTYDLEVWLPGQDRYREISSCSNCWDFQGRRMRARFRPNGGKGTEFVHTLNGSGLAVGRTMIAIIENYQNPDGTITVPDVLRPYMGGIEKLSPMVG
ncbi:MAG: serine--tRNA ligase [Alphaproteobacteria bacterium]|jgi:seryl-tRNA synthetase|nr:serine--tRNA ligase [Alphaproteobacteria bacterium]